MVSIKATSLAPTANQLLKIPVNIIDTRLSLLPSQPSRHRVFVGRRNSAKKISFSVDTDVLYRVRMSV